MLPLVAIAVIVHERHDCRSYLSERPLHRLLPLQCLLLGQRTVSVPIVHVVHLVVFRLAPQLPFKLPGWPGDCARPLDLDNASCRRMGQVGGACQDCTHHVH